MSDQVVSARRAVFGWFGLLGAAVGLLVGVGEAALLSRVPHVPPLQTPDVRYVIWFLAPLAGMALFGLLGFSLGLLAALQNPLSSRWNLYLLGSLVGTTCAYVASALWLFHVREGDLISWSSLVPLFVGFGVGTMGTLLASRRARRAKGYVLDRLRTRPPRFPAGLVAFAGLMSLLGVALYPLRLASNAAHASPAATKTSPNIVLISLDTVRADHLSAYGYTRPTTPNIDRLADQGVLFESAISPSAWTLTSHASMFSGLLPHQHGANWSVPLDGRFRTLAELLTSYGYETGGFTSNIFYGQDGWGMGQGFSTFDDDSASRRHNLAATLTGRALVQPLYQHLVHYDLFDRRDAREVNADVFRWLEGRSSRPYFLFINYFDAHDPYTTGTAHDARFGQIRKSLIKQINSIDGVQVPEPLSAEEQASLITGYDNCVAFLDEQVGNLVETLRRSRSWSNTIVIITSDHGEGFGEHDRYGHGWNVYREAVHVPLVFLGAGIPVGLRISHLARTRELFPTVLDLAVGERLPLRRVSLRRFWTPGFQPEAFDDFVISETMENTPLPDPYATIGLMTSEWHYIHDRTGQVELYRWRADPAEKLNLADSPQHREALGKMRERLREYLRSSVRPWNGATYLFALDEPGYSFMLETAFAPLLPSTTSEAQFRVGAVQTLFAPDAPSAAPRPSLSDEDSMKSLPYR